MKSQNLLIALTLLASLISCRKDEAKKNDFRETYIGEYEIYVHSHHWQMGTNDY